MKNIVSKIVFPALPLHYIKSPRFKAGKKTCTGSRPIPLSNPCLFAAIPTGDKSKSEATSSQEVARE